MLLLLISAFWVLTLLLIISLCIAARNSDLQQNRSTSPAMPGEEPIDLNSVVTITQAKQGQHTTPAHAPPVGAGGLWSRRSGIRVPSLTLKKCLENRIFCGRRVSRLRRVVTHGSHHMQSQW